ncbi:unnamed protein product [marine sediment metagenome]|uniref:Uncharacterized protein n=1 Tax=marine sediment metagenome TaxID=412755 RepID=X0V8T7_9ZZZZ
MTHGTWIEMVRQHRLSVHIDQEQQEMSDAQARMQMFLQERALELTPFFEGDELVLRKDGRKLFDFRKCWVEHVRGELKQGYMIRVKPLKKDGTLDFGYVHVAHIWPAYAKFWDRIAREVTIQDLRTRERNRAI